MPITAPQVLWVNMVTSVALGLVISFEPNELDVMNRPPRAVDLPILTGFWIWRVVFVGLALLAVTPRAFFWMTSQGASAISSPNGSSRSRWKCKSKVASEPATTMCLPADCRHPRW